MNSLTPYQEKTIHWIIRKSVEEPHKGGVIVTARGRAGQTRVHFVDVRLSTDIPSGRVVYRDERRDYSVEAEQNDLRALLAE